MELLPQIFRLAVAITLCIVCFERFSNRRETLLLGFSLIYLILFLGTKTMGCILACSAAVFFLLKKADEKPALYTVVFITVTLLYFGIMKLPRGGFFKHLPSVQTLGLSYLYWRFIHLTFELKNKKLTLTSASRFFLYLLYFPAMAGGPLERYESFYNSPFFKMDRFRADFNSGFFLRIALGFLKIYLGSLLFISAAVWNNVYALSYASLVKILYFNAFSFYFTVSGCNDIGISASRILRIPLLENYNYPYLQPNLALFWNHWHISLSNMLRDYVYIPLGGSKVRPNLNLVLTFLFSAFWHVISPAFLIWGLMHGIGMVVLRNWKNFWKARAHPLKAFPKLAFVLGVLITFHFVALSWLPFNGGFPQGTWVLLKLLRIHR